MTVTPELTLTQRVLAACDAEDWAAASELLSAHEAWVHAEVAEGRLRNEGELLRMLDEQQKLAEVLRHRLSKTADELGAIGQASRGARAYRTQGGR